MRRKMTRFLLNQNPWALLMVFLFSIVFAIIAFWGNTKTLNYSLPTYTELQVMEGIVDDFSVGSGKDNVYYELVLDNKTYYLNKYIVYDNGLLEIIQKGAKVKIWSDDHYKDTIPNQIYEIEINENKCLSYQGSCDFLISYYYQKGALSGTRLMLLAFIACAYVCASFAFQLRYKP